MTFICETCVATGDNLCATDGAHLGRALRAWAIRDADVDPDAEFLRKYADCYPAV